MADIESHIRKALFYNMHGDSRLVPREILEANCLVVGYDAETTRETLDEMVAAGTLREEDGCYARIDE